MVSYRAASCASSLLSVFLPCRLCSKNMGGQVADMDCEYREVRAGERVHRGLFDSVGGKA